MLVGSLSAWAWIPEVQCSRKMVHGGLEEGNPRQLEEEKQRNKCNGNKIPSKTLETLSLGRDEGIRQGGLARADKEVIHKYRA